MLVTSGSQHGLTAVFATLLRPGDLVLTESLTYAGMKALAELLHVRLQGLPMDAHGLRPDAFEDACRAGAAKALYCVPTLQNPTATVMPEARRREIAHIARAHGVLIVEDDVYGLLLDPAPAADHDVRARDQLLPDGHREDPGAGPARRLPAGASRRVGPPGDAACARPPGWRRRSWRRSPRAGSQTAPPTRRAA